MPLAHFGRGNPPTYLICHFFFPYGTWSYMKHVMHFVPPWELLNGNWKMKNITQHRYYLPVTATSSYNICCHFIVNFVALTVFNYALFLKRFRLSYNQICVFARSHLQHLCVLSSKMYFRIRKLIISILTIWLFCPVRVFVEYRRKSTFEYVFFFTF